MEFKSLRVPELRLLIDSITLVTIFALGNTKRFRYTDSMAAVIFDFDGTIADSFDVVLHVFYEITRHEPFTAEQIAELRQVRSPRKLAKLAGLSPRQAPRVFIRGRTLMARHMGEIKPFPGTEPALAGLRREGHRLFVMSSNSQRNVREFLRNHSLQQYFEGIYGGVGLLSKAGALNKVLRQNRLDPADSFYIGDEVRDILAAKRTDVRAVAVAWGYNDVSVLESEAPFAIAKSPKALPKIVADKRRGTGVLSRAKLFGFRRQQR